MQTDTPISDRTSLILFIVCFIIANLGAATEVLKFVAAFLAVGVAGAKAFETYMQYRNKNKPNP